MRIIIGTKEIIIPSSLNDTADRMTNLILNTLRTKTAMKRQTPLFYAVVVSLHVKTAEILKYIDDNDLQELLNSWEYSGLENQD